MNFCYFCVSPIILPRVVIIVIDRFFEVVGIGLILTMISAIILFIDQPKAQAFVNNGKDPIQDNPEEVNTDDLFN